MRVLGIDYGEKRMGIAISDATGTIASGVAVIGRSGSISADLKELKQIIKKYGGVDEIVIGLPKTLKGEIGASAKLVLSFVDELKGEISVPITTWDERYSTVAVERVLKEANLSRARRKMVVDKSAAVYLLQGYLEFNAGRGSRS